MRRLDLKKIPHAVKIGDVCGDIEPTITEDTGFFLDDQLVGFYIKKLTGKIAELVDIANAELLSDRVPKSEMRRSSGLFSSEHEVKQFSTIIGACPPKPHMMRPYPTISSVHQVESAKNFIKAMLLVCEESEKLLEGLAPEIFKRQLETIEASVPPQFRFGRCFTSSISNFNIAAPFHIDAGNLQGCVNVIIAKKQRAKGGNMTVPDYGLTVDSSDGSMLVYPAWANVHGVTPIRPTMKGGYRNSLIFYPLKAFSPYW